MVRLLAVLLTVVLSGCGGIFLPPGPSGRVCIYDLQGAIVPKGDCGCYYLKGAFTWKHYVLLPCPREKTW